MYTNDEQVKRMMGRSIERYKDVIAYLTDNGVNVEEIDITESE